MSGRPDKSAAVRALGALLEERTGFVLPPTRAGLLAEVCDGTSGIELPVPTDDLAPYLRRRSPRSDRTFESILHHVLPRETSFFRDRPQLDSLRQEWLPGRLRRAAVAPLRALSAGCATGEEAYSLAIALHEAASHVPREVVGLDVDVRSIEAARAGRYGAYSFRGVRDEEKARFFVPDGDELAVRPEIRRTVRFVPGNLVSDPLDATGLDLGLFDVILCRNVLLYFSEESARVAVARLSRVLAPGGVLLVGHAETALGIFDGLAVRRLAGTYAFERAATAAPAGSNGPDPGAWSRPAATDALLDEVRRLYGRREYDAANRRLSGLRENPLHRAEAAYWSARIAANRGAAAAARRDVDVCLALRPGDPRALHLRALLLLQEGRAEEGIDALRGATASPEAPAAAFHLLGSLLRKRGRDDEARRVFAAGLDALTGLREDEALPDADGLTAGAVRALLRAGRGAP